MLGTDSIPATASESLHFHSEGVHRDASSDQTARRQQVDGVVQYEGNSGSCSRLRSAEVESVLGRALHLCYYIPQEGVHGGRNADASLYSWLVNDGYCNVAMELVRLVTS